MEDNKEELIVILAGYKLEMQHFIDTNPGLRSRFPIHVDFHDYSSDELLKIADLMLKRKQYRLDQAGREELKTIIELFSTRHRHSGNARLVRNLVERAIRLQAVRLVKKNKLTRDDLMTITRQDLVKVWDYYTTGVEV